MNASHTLLLRRSGAAVTGKPRRLAWRPRLPWLLCLPWLACLLGVFAWSGSARADVRISKTASRHFKLGVQYLTSSDPERFERAYSEFRAAYADSPSWKILGNLGIAADGLERDSEAIEAYRAYVEKGGKDLRPGDRAQFKADWERLELVSSSITLQTKPDGAWVVDERATTDGRLVVNRYGPSAGPLELRLRAGHHRIHAELNGHDSEIWEFESRPGATSSHTLELERPAPRPAPPPPQEAPVVRPPSLDERADKQEGSSGSRVLGYTTLGLGAAAAAVGTVFLVQSIERRSDGDAAFSLCKPTQADPDPPDCKRSRAKTREEGTAKTRALIGYGVAGALVTTGILLLVYSGGPSEDSASLAPWIGPGQLGLTGRF